MVTIWLGTADHPMYPSGTKSSLQVRVLLPVETVEDAFSFWSGR
jgi:hypothetical protein